MNLKQNYLHIAGEVSSSKQQVLRLNFDRHLNSQGSYWIPHKVTRFPIISLYRRDRFGQLSCALFPEIIILNEMTVEAI